MIPPVKPGVTLPMPMDLVIETERLLLRRWRDADVAPNTEMLGDPAAARFITSDGKAVTDEFVGWRNAALSHFAAGEIEEGERVPGAGGHAEIGGAASASGSMRLAIVLGEGHGFVRFFGAVDRLALEAHRA